jgi:hypothetical protein
MLDLNNSFFPKFPLYRLTDNRECVIVAKQTAAYEKHSVVSSVCGRYVTTSVYGEPVGWSFIGSWLSLLTTANHLELTLQRWYRAGSPDHVMVPLMVS